MLIEARDLVQVPLPRHAPEDEEQRRHLEPELPLEAPEVLPARAREELVHLGGV